MEQFFSSDQSVMFFVLVAAMFVMLKFLPRLTLGVPFLDPELVKAKMDVDGDFLILDVRTEKEFASNTGHMPGAMNLPLSDIKARLKDGGEALEAFKEVPICVVCRTENRSPKAARILKNAGFKNLSVMKGGIMRWNREKLPTEGRG